jgi:glycolate oxidase
MPMDRATLIQRLQAVCGESGVVHTSSDLMVYEYDGSVDGSVETASPIAVTLPTSTEQVAAIVRLANQAGLPVTARGAGTGLSGGAVTQDGGIIIALTRMDRILEIDREDRTALVEPGVINLELSETTTPLGMFFAPDPSSQRACTIGGNVAENSGGPHCLKYGVTSNHILGLEIVLPSGDVVWTGGHAYGTPGYDLTGAMVGSEGMFGIVTKALVRLTPNPEQTLVQLAAFPDLDTASLAVSRIIAAGILPASLEMMDNLTIQAVEPVYHAGYPMDAGGVLLVETDGLTEEVAAIGEEITRICKEADATEVRSATEKAQRDLLWKGRKMALAAMGRLAPNYYLHDTVVPRSQLPATVGRVREISTEYGLEIANVFHAGDGNLHPLMLFDRRKPGDVERVLEAGKEIITWCVSVGGALSGEHGIGTEKRGYMTMVYTGEDLAAMAGLRNAFDPGGRFNPGKVFPKGYMCGEVRALRTQAMAQKHGIHPL